MLLRVNGIDIKTPNDVQISRFNIVRAARLSTGKMTQDLIAKKYKIFISYQILAGDELQRILDQIDTNNPFFTVRFEANSGDEVERTFYAGEIRRRRFRTDGRWWWKDVTFNFIEQ